MHSANGLTFQLLPVIWFCCDKEKCFRTWPADNQGKKLTFAWDITFKENKILFNFKVESFAAPRKLNETISCGRLCQILFLLRIKGRGEVGEGLLFYLHVAMRAIIHIVLSNVCFTLFSLQHAWANYKAAHKPRKGGNNT